MKLDKIKIFVVEDNDWYQKMLVHTLELNPDFEVKSFSTGAELNEALKQDQAQIITLDYRLPDFTGDVLLKNIKSEYPDIEVVMISEQNDIDTAVDLLKSGAYDYLVKNNDIRDRLIHSVNKIVEKRNLREEVIQLRSQINKKYDFSESVIGNSDAMRSVYELVQKSLHVDITVSIYGETGTGKEVIANTIHYNSNRSSKKFVPVNIAAIPTELIESELFGHEKGAFTGAIQARKGKFEEADGGTLFLDEIGEIDLNFQKKLLRVLQEREVVRVGSNKSIKTDCRIIVATNKDLSDLVKEGKFREDLFYRLKGLPIILPPLRERKEDILLLADHFNNKFAKKNRMTLKEYSEDAKNKLLSYQWPGNVRELKSVVDLAAVLSNSDEILPEDIHLGSSKDLLPDLFSENLSLREYEIKIVRHYMQKHNDDTKKVAEDLQIGQTTVYRLLKEAQKSQ